MDNYTAFKALHKNKTPLLLANVWNAHTARLAQDAGFAALGSSSHAIANMLGYEDGEAISFDALLFIVRHIATVATVPLSVDFEAGYSDDPAQVAKYVQQLTDIGVAGINLEDSHVIAGKRILGDTEMLAEKIKAIKEVTSVFINARTDTYTTKHPDSLQETISRALVYQAAGADGIFVPLIEKEADLATFVAQVKLPLNVFASATLPAYDTLASIGVKRISHGAKQYELLMKQSADIYKRFQETKDYGHVLGK